MQDQRRSGIVADEQAEPVTIAELCHLVRTPLNGILGSLELLIDGDLSDASLELARGAFDAAMALYLLFEHNLPADAGRTAR